MKFILLTLFVLCASVAISKAQSVVPVKESGSKFSISCANLTFVVDSALGSRITSFKIDKSELLYTNTSEGMQGSTFWPSPQSVWNWPPLANLDNKPYKTSINGNKITFSGSTDSKTSLRFHKTMFASIADTSIVIDYIIKNEKASAQKWAPWEVTRVLAKGITVFAKGEGSVTGKMSSFTEELNGYVWYNQDIHKATSSDFKFFCDGKGWLAHVANGDILFLKVFENIPNSSAALNETEIEVYTTNGNTYTELENQGAYVSIPSKDSVTWRVKWYARKLPSSVSVSVGSKSLTDYIESLVARGATTSASKLSTSTEASIYPNPADDFICISNHFFGNDNISIFNTKGVRLINQRIGEGNMLSVKELEEGLYLYYIESGNKTVSGGSLLITR